MRKHLLALGLLGLLAAIPVFAQAPPSLNDDQRARVRAIRQKFEQQRQSDMAEFEGRIESILDKEQKSRWDKDRAAFKAGEAKARQQLGSELAEEDDVPPPPGGPPPPPPPPPPGMDPLAELHLTPLQQGEVHVFHEALMVKQHAAMRAMMKQLHDVLGDPPRGGPRD